MKTWFGAAVLALAAAGVGTGAAAETVIAKLEKPLQTSAKPVAGDALFECLGDVCAAREASDEAAGIRGCRELVRQVGSVTSFGPSSRPLAAEKLADCNHSARK